MLRVLDGEGAEEPARVILVLRGQSVEDHAGPIIEAIGEQELKSVLAAFVVVRSNGPCEIVLAQTGWNFGLSPPIPVRGGDPEPVKAVLKQRQVIGVVRELVHGVSARLEGSGWLRAAS